MAVDGANPDCAAVGDDIYCHLPEALEAASPSDTIEVQASGTLSLAGPPLSRVATEVGDNCLVDISFPVRLTGTLEVTGPVDYRILVHGPRCQPFVFDEEWIVLADFTGSVDGVEGSLKAIFTAEVRNSGIITGNLAFGAGTGGLVGISGAVEYRDDTSDGEPGIYNGQVSINVPFIAGDANRDGAVDFADFQVLSSSFGQQGDWSAGDFDLDGTVGFSDFLLMAENFGSPNEQ